MNFNCLFSIFSFKRDKAIAVFVKTLLSHRSQFTMQADHRSGVADLVMTFPKTNGLKSFLHAQFPMIDKTRVMVHGDWHGNQYSGATLAMRNGY